MVVEPKFFRNNASIGASSLLVSTTVYSYDNTLAETDNGLYKSEMIGCPKKPWHSVITS